MSSSCLFIKNAKYFAIAFTFLSFITFYFQSHSWDAAISTRIISHLKNSFQRLDKLNKFIREKDTKIVIWKGNKEVFQTMVERVSENSCFKGCQIKISSKQEDADEAEVLIFFMLTQGFQKKDLPQRKSPEQIWIYRQMEPVQVYTPRNYMNGLFNLTMTYRRDSDIFDPYSWTIPKQDRSSDSIIMPGNTSLKEWVGRKGGLATAVISNCRAPSKRLRIIQKLRNSGLPIDLFGRCGGQPAACSRVGNECSDDYWTDLGAKYKFFLAFENSFCVDYITEKLWRTLELGMVPVVLGRGRYAETAPPHSFIDIRDFSGPQELTNYLLHLDKDSEAYAEYFQWRKHSQIVSKDGGVTDLCLLCEKLKKREKVLQNWDRLSDSSLLTKTYLNIVEWWTTAPQGYGGGPACLSPEGMGLANFL